MNQEFMCSAEQHRLTPQKGRRRAVVHRLTPATIQAAVRARYRVIRACHEELMSRIDSAVSGRVEVRFRIAMAGTVDDVCFLDSDLEDQRFALCILTEFKNLQYASTEETTIVNYPIMFEP